MVSKAQHDGEEEGAEMVLSPGRECSEMLKMVFWGIIFPSPLSMKNEGLLGEACAQSKCFISIVAMPSIELMSPL